MTSSAGVSLPIILCVDDEPAILAVLGNQLRAAFKKEFRIETAESGEEALEIIEELPNTGQEIAVLITDQIMPGMKGDELLIKAHEHIPETPKILLTGQTQLDAVRNAINHAKLSNYIQKPWDREALILTVGEAARNYLQRSQLLEFGQHNRLLKMLNKSTQEISGEMETPMLVEKLIRNLLINTLAERIAVFLENNNELELAGYHNVEESERLSTDLPENAAELTAKFRLLLELFDKQSAAPWETFAEIRNGGQLLGYIWLSNPNERKLFNANQREIVGMLASQAAISLLNARLYSQLNEAFVQLSEQNHKIVESINAARRIQFDTLPDIQMIQAVLPESFIFLKPRDVVSGDFYWFCKQEKRVLLAAVDCTGHGVPGAFMCMLGNSVLNQIIADHPEINPGEILNLLNKRVLQALKQSGDGMDITLCSIELHDNSIGGGSRTGSIRMEYAAAKNPLYLIRNGHLAVCPADKFPIGGRYYSDRFFTNQHVELRPGDRIYMFSDGFADQFGGPKGRKYTYKQLQETFLSLQSVAVSGQGAELSQYLADWQGDNAQVDDILVIGVGF
jgi:serine phosphatase RsbU (regulator of sigma subunit)/FixJ family two-component response regulator